MSGARRRRGQKYRRKRGDRLFGNHELKTSPGEIPPRRKENSIWFGAHLLHDSCGSPCQAELGREEKEEKEEGEGRWRRRRRGEERLERYIVYVEYREVRAHVRGESPPSLRERGLCARGPCQKRKKEFSEESGRASLLPLLQLSRASPGQSATGSCQISGVRVNWVIVLPFSMTRTTNFNSRAGDHLRFHSCLAILVSRFAIRIFDEGESGALSVFHFSCLFILERFYSFIFENPVSSVPYIFGSSSLESGKFILEGRRKRFS